MLPPQPRPADFDDPRERIAKLIADVLLGLQRRGGHARISDQLREAFENLPALAPPGEPSLAALVKGLRSETFFLRMADAAADMHEADSYGLVVMGAARIVGRR